MESVPFLVHFLLCYRQLFLVRHRYVGREPPGHTGPLALGQLDEVCSQLHSWSQLLGFLHTDIHTHIDKYQGFKNFCIKYLLKKRGAVLYKAYVA